MLRNVVCAVILASLTVIAACGNGDVGKTKLGNLEVGMSKTDALGKMGTGPLTAVGADTARLNHGFRQMKYFTAGKTIEVIYYREEAGAVSESVEQHRETPVVFGDDKVLGWGWKYYVEAMKTYQLPTPLVEKDTTHQVPAQPVGMQGQRTMPTTITPPKAKADSTKKP